MADITQEMLIAIEANTWGLVKGMDAVIEHLDKFDKGLSKVEKNTNFVNQALAVFTGTLATKVVGGLTKAFDIIKGGFDRFVNLAKGATLESARIEVQWRTLSMTAAKMGITFEDVQKAVGGLRAAGIKTSEALQVMTQWLSAGLPSEKLSELSRAAQDLAVVLGTDSTAAMERFNWFVQTGNSELLRTVGIMQTSTQMEEKFAAGIGKTRDQLTDQERRLARVNGLLEATVAYAGSYEEAMKDPFKRLTSLPRLISNVTEAIGAVFVPLLGAGVDIVSDLLEKIERLFRVTKKEAKETGQAIGEWKEGFLKLRAVVTAFANWFMSIWNRVTGGFNQATESMMDRFVNAIIRGVKAAADALRKFATFVASIFGGRAPAAVTEAGIAATKPPTKPETPRPAPPVAQPTEIMAAPKEAAKLRAKPVAAPAAEDIAQYGELSRKWAAATAKLADASNKAAKARAAMARAEEWLERASEKVYDIRRKIQRLELDWAEIPERFIRGRKRQLQIEQMAAEHEEHERKKVVDAERERLRLAEAYERQVEQAADKIKREMDKVGDAISKQAEKYDEWLGKLAEAEEIQIVEPVQAVVNEFESLDDLTAGYLEEIEGELMPAFASIEESVMAIADNLGVAWEKAKGLGADLLEKLKGIPEVIGQIKWRWGEVVEAWQNFKVIVDYLVETLKELFPFDRWAAQFAGLWNSIPEPLRKLLMWGALGPAGVGGEFLIGAAEKAAEGEGLLDALWSSITEKTEDTVETIKGAWDWLSETLLTGSVIPDLVLGSEDWLARLDTYAGTILDQLTGRLEILDQVARGLLPSLESLRLASGKDVQFFHIDFSHAQFGGDLTESQVKGWMYEVIPEVVS